MEKEEKQKVKYCQCVQVRLHTHLAENQEDIDDSETRFGCRPGEYIKCDDENDERYAVLRVFDTVTVCHCVSLLYITVCHCVLLH